MYKQMKRIISLGLWLVGYLLPAHAAPTNTFPSIQETPHAGFFPLSEAAICIDANDFRVVEITAGMLADDVERVTGKRPQLSKSNTLPEGVAVVAGTLGH